MPSLEEQRKANLQRNAELLKQLELESLSQGIFEDGKSAKTRVSKPTKAKRKPAVKKEPAAELPRRKSRRLAGEKAESQLLKEEDDRAFDAFKQLEQERRTRVDGEQNLKELLKNNKHDGADEDDWKKVTQQAFDVLSSVTDKVSTGDYFNVFKSNTTIADPDISRCRESLSSLQLYSKHDPNDVKLVPERIVSLVLHPLPTKQVAFAGDKTGNLGVWNMSTDDDEPNVLTLKVHSRAIHDIAINGNKIYTSSYDGSVRCLDLNNPETSKESFVLSSDPRNPTGMSEIKIIDDNLLYFCTLEGQFGVHDLRTPATKSADLYQLHPKKIGGFSVNPMNTNQICTASLDRSLKVWDIRSIDLTKSNAFELDEEQGEQPAGLLGYYDSRLSVSSADWNQNGEVVANGYDDTINLFDLKALDTSSPIELEPYCKLRHNCQTGRWVSILKSRWQARPADGINKFAIGNMSRFIDIYSSKGEQLAHLGDESLTAVPAVVAFHPTENWILGGSASGKVFLWS